MGRKTVYNILVDEKEWEQVNEDNKELMEDFLDYLTSIGRSEGTVKQYNNDLRIFFTWYLKKGKNKHFTEMKKRELIAFQGFLLSQCGMSPARIRRLRSSLSSLSNYIENILDEEYPNFRNIINKIEAPVLQPVREKVVITFEDCAEVADTLVKKGKIQLACYLMVACYSGLRKQEMTRLLVDDFLENKQMVLKDSFYKTSPIKVKGRGNKTQEKYVWNRCDKWLNLWLDYRKENDVNCKYLFCRKTKEGYKKMKVSTADSFANTFKRYVHPNFYTHALRHTLATEITRADLPIEAVKFLLGHKSAETSRIYVDISEDENMEKFANFFNGEVEKFESKTLEDI